MIKEKIKKFVKSFLEEIEKEYINIGNISKEYYEILKLSDNEEEINNKIIQRLKNHYLPKNINIESLFNKNKELSAEELEGSFENISNKVIKALNDNNPKDIYTLDIKTTKSIIKNEIMDWNFFKEYFAENVSYWKIKEAIGWIAAYAETEDYEPNKILQYDNGVLNKKQTLKNILIDINKKSLTEVKPFLTRYNKEELDKNGNFNFKYCPALSGEVDVMIWSEKKQKAIGSSVTRDRSVDIEGNQFIRHYMKLLAMTLDVKSNQSRKNKGDSSLTRMQYRNYIKSNDYKSLSSKIKNERNMKQDIINEISENIIDSNGKEVNVKNNFLKDLITVRLNIKRETGKDFINNKNISKEEMEEIINIGRKNIEYNYFGELLNSENKELNKINAGFNSFGYTSNYKDIGNVKLGLENAATFLKEIKFNYNHEVGNNSFNYGIELAKISLLTTKENFAPIAEGLSRGKSFDDERKNFYRSIQSFLKIIKNSKNKIETMKNQFGISNSESELLLDRIKEEDFCSEFEEKLDMIKINQSDVSLDKENTVMIAENLSMKLQKEEIMENKEIMAILKNKQSKKRITLGR